MFNMSKPTLYIVYRMKKVSSSWNPTFRGSFDDCHSFIKAISKETNKLYFYKFVKTSYRILKSSSLDSNKKVSLWFDNHLIR